jgi:hypothetical protein
MDNSMPSSSSSLFNIPQLAEDGSNWVTYKHCMTIVLGAHGLGEYVDGTAVRPILITTATSRSGIIAMTEEIKENRKEVAKCTQKDYLIQQHIFRTVTDRMMLQISHQTTGAAMWKEIKMLHEGKSTLVKADVRKHMLLARCDEGRDVKAHFGGTE